MQNKASKGVFLGSVFVNRIRRTPVKKKFYAKRTASLSAGENGSRSVFIALNQEKINDVKKEWTFQLRFLSLLHLLYLK
jgi:hypothetical protein